jgi:hypothetical protein
MSLEPGHIVTHPLQTASCIVTALPFLLVHEMQATQGGMLSLDSAFSIAMARKRARIDADKKVWWYL